VYGLKPKLKTRLLAQQPI